MQTPMNILAKLMGMDDGTEPMTEEEFMEWTNEDSKEYHSIELKNKDTNSKTKEKEPEVKPEKINMKEIQDVGTSNNDKKLKNNKFLDTVGGKVIQNIDKLNELNKSVSNFKFSTDRSCIRSVRSKIDKKIYLDKLLEKPYEDIDDEKYEKILRLLTYPNNGIDLFYESDTVFYLEGEKDTKFVAYIDLILAIYTKLYISLIANIINGGKYSNDFELIDADELIKNKLFIEDNEITDKTLAFRLENISYMMYLSMLMSTTGDSKFATPKLWVLSYLSISNNFELMLNKLFIRNIMYNRRIYDLSDSDIRLIGIQIASVSTIIKKDIILSVGFLHRVKLVDLRKTYFNRCNYLNEFLVNNF